MEQINILDYGTTSNITVAVTEALKYAKTIDGEVTIKFPKNKYHFYKDYAQVREYHTSNTDSIDNPKKSIAFLIENQKDITIDGDGSEFVIHGDIMALCTAYSKNITLENFTINYDSPTDVELSVKKIENKKVIYSIPKNNLWYVENNKAIFFEQSPFTKQNYWSFSNRGDGWCVVLHRQNCTFRLPNIKTPFTFYKSLKRLNETDLEIVYSKVPNYQIGDTIALSQNKIRNTAGCFNFECENTVVKNVDVNYMQGFGWLTQMCENATFDSVRFISSKDRKTTSFADCIHISGAKGNININNCYFSNAHDDGINIHGTFMRVKEKISNRVVKLEYVHSQQGGFPQYHIGDQVVFYYRNNLLPCGKTYTVKEVINPFENELNGKETIITEDKDLPLDIDCVKKGQKNIVAENKTYCPNVNITNCKFFNIPTRGILATTSGDVLIKNNEFENVAMANIFVSNDSKDWYESGPVRNMKIISNKFTIPKSNQKEWSNAPAIFVKPIVLGNRCKSIVHKNIVVKENVFNVFDDRAIFANNVENMTIENNVFNCAKKNKFKNCKNIIEKV